jgi:hypothetical protein
MGRLHEGCPNLSWPGQVLVKHRAVTILGENLPGGSRLGQRVPVAGIQVAQLSGLNLLSILIAVSNPP